MGNRHRLTVLSSIAGLAVLAACSSSGHDDPAPAPASPTGTIQPSLARGVLAQPDWATGDRFTGRMKGDEALPIQVHLRLRNEKEADAEIDAITDPDSPRFGQYLTSEQFDQKYAPTAEDVAEVRAHLEANGLTVTHVPGNRAYVAAQGSAAQVERAFGAKLGLYQVRGRTRHAPMEAARIPSHLADRVSTVLGLSSSPEYHPHGVHVGGIRRDSISHGDGTVPANTCSQWYGQKLDSVDPPYGSDYPALTYAPCGYKPGQLRNAYGFRTPVRKGNDGHGVTVAIIDAFQSPTLLADAQTYAAQNDPDYPLDASQFTATTAPGTPPQFVDTGWYAEQTLDVEAVHAMAPGANIAYVAAQDATEQDLIAALNLVVANKLGTIVSNSYGTTEGSPTNFLGWGAVLKQAALKGIGVYFASGDYGDESMFYGTPVASFPASHPQVTAVGGTSLALGSRDDRLFEVGWETGVSYLETPFPPPPPPDGDGGIPDGGGADASFDGSALAPHAATGIAAAAANGATWFPPAPGFFGFGSGGGTSKMYDQPAYQANVVPADIANLPGVPARVIPDVAMLGDPITGFLIGQSINGVYAEAPIGGTSLSCPLFAGVMAIAEQKVKHTIGFANPQLYKVRAKAFIDVVPGTTKQAVAYPNGVVASFEYPDLSIHTAAGYDNVTGLGTPDGERFLKAIK